MPLSDVDVMGHATLFFRIGGEPRLTERLATFLSAPGWWAEVKWARRKEW